MELQAASAGAQQQLAGDRTHESRMDEYLRSLGFYRKKIAKDGSCLFRAVAEQVLHCQGLHTKVRAACVNYLKQNRSNYELFIEGDFEKYLENLRDPQSWVGQVEITVLAELYKHDFIIFQVPDQPPVNITENGFPDKVRLCFLNGNHYDSVYPQSFEKSAAVCQSILYELLYERVCGVDRSVLGSCVKGGRGREKLDSEECKSSEESDLEEDEFWSSESGEKTASVTNARPPRGRGRGQPRGRGRGFLSAKAQKSLNPALYRNVEYDVWLRSKRIQQQRDFCIAAGMQYAIGDKCKVQLSGSNRFYNAYVKEVSPDNGPVTVFIEELNRPETVPLLSLRLPPEEPQLWQTVSDKSKRHSVPNNGAQTPSEWETRGGRRSNKAPLQSASSGRVNKQHSWPPQAFPEEKFRRSEQRGSPVCVLPEEEEESVVLELLHKDELNFPSLGTSPQTATAGEVVKKGGERKGSRKKEQKECVSETETSQKPVQRQKSTTEEKPGIRVSEEPVQRSSPTIKEKLQEKPMPVSPTPHPAVIFSGPKTVPSSSATPPGLDKSSLEAKTPIQPKNSHPRSPYNSQLVSTLQPISVAAVSVPIQSAPALKPTQPSLQTTPVLPTSEKITHSNQAPSQTNLVASPITPVQVPPAIPTRVALASSGSIPDAPVESTPPIQTTFISNQPLLPASAIPVAPAAARIPDAPEPPSTTLPIDERSGPPIAQKTVDSHTAMTPIPLPKAHAPSISPSSGPAHAPPPDLPQSPCNASDPQPCETSAIPSSGVAPAPDHPSQPQQMPYPHLQWSQLLQDPVYPGFPLNEKGEVEPLPPFSLSQKGEDLPQDINILKFFFNLGVKAYSQPMFPPIIYLGPLNQAYQMHLRAPPPPDSPANPTMTSWQPENPSPPRNSSSIPETSLASHAPVAPVPVGSGPVGPIEMGGYNDHPQSLPMQVPPRVPMPWSTTSGQSAYSGNYPASPQMQFSAQPCGPHGNQMYSPSSVGYHHIQPQSMPHEALNHVPHGRMDVLPFVPSTLDRGQENGQRPMNMSPHYGSMHKIPGFPGTQPQLGSGDYKPVDIPVSMATMQPQHYPGACPVVQPFQLGQMQGDMTSLGNGNLGRVYAYSPDDNWSVEEMEILNVDLRNPQSYYSQAYRSGGRRGQEDRGGYRGRSHRGRKDYSSRGRPDDQSSYRHYGRRGAGPRVGQMPYQ
ncbi:putative bifunctional UDP-N-acetylglucosamine transferase and deubiquitinase ALG13 [Pimephales promelas]|nr:putative bifunctional UDP-N-acetylglucosamine transferase and deubiquitinase ALG13 [Pimephales promelas]